jgi:hypothetical protein
MMRVAGKLTQTIAEATGISLEVAILEGVTHRAAGLISDARTRPLTPLDASRLLIGLLATDKPSDMAPATRAFGGLRCGDGGGVWEVGSTFSYDAGLKLPPHNHPFEVAVAAILKQIADLPPGVELPKIDIVINVNKLLAQIFIGAMRFEYTHATLSDLANQLTDDPGPFLHARRKYQSKISIRREVDKTVLADIAAYFRKKEDTINVCGN